MKRLIGYLIILICLQTSNGALTPAGKLNLSYISILTVECGKRDCYFLHYLQITMYKEEVNID